jgi:hypothetical protein
MTIALDNVKTASRTVTNHSGTFASAPAPIHMDRYGGTGDFVPVSFKLHIEEAISEPTKYALTVTVHNDAGNPMTVTYAHPYKAQYTFDGEKDRENLIDCPDDIVEAVSTIPGVHIDNVVKQLRIVADIMRYV